MSKRAVLYARVSSDDTRRDGRNLEGQLEMCRNYAQQHGYEVIAELAEDDRGASGASFELPRLNRVLEMARGSEFDILVVREIDRLSRRLAKQLIVEEELKRHGVQIQYVLGDYPDTPEGSLMKNIRATIAEYEKEKIRERLTRGRRQVVNSGSVLLHGNHPPYGYRLSDDSKTLVIYEPEARIVRLIFTWYVEGDGDGRRLGLVTIARRLTEMGIPTWCDTYGCGPKKSVPGQWSYGTIANILKNETYIGLWHYGRRGKGNKLNPRSHWLTIEVPAIISQELWDKVQTQKRCNKEMAKRNAKYNYLVGRRVTCGRCGQKMCGKSYRRKGYVSLYYRCVVSKGKRAGRTCDLSCFFRADYVDAAVWNWVKSFLSDPVALQNGLNEYQADRERENAPLRERLKVVEDLLADNQTQLRRLLDLYLAGDFPKEVLIERKKRLETTMDALEKERTSLSAQLEAQTLTSEQIQSLKDFATEVAEGLERADADFETRRQIIDTLDVRATLAIEDEEKVVYVRCIIGDDVLSVANNSIRLLRVNIPFRLTVAWPFHLISAWFD